MVVSIISIFMIIILLIIIIGYILNPYLCFSFCGTVYLGIDQFEQQIFQLRNHLYLDVVYLGPDYVYHLVGEVEVAVGRGPVVARAVRPVALYLLHEVYGYPVLCAFEFQSDPALELNPLRSID